MLSRAWDGCLNARVAEARALSQILGDDHDLALLVGFVHSERACRLERGAGHRHREAGAAAPGGTARASPSPSGVRLFSEGARNLRRSIAAYWEAAVVLKEQEPEEEEPKETPKKTRAQPAARRRAAAPQAT